MREGKVGRTEEGFILGGFCPIVKLQQPFNLFWETGSFEYREWEATLRRLAWQRPCCAFPVNPLPDRALFTLALDLARAAPVGRSAASKPPQEAGRPRVFSAPSSSRFGATAASDEKPVSLPARGRAVLQQKPDQKSPAQTSRRDPAVRRRPRDDGPSGPGTRAQAAGAVFKTALQHAHVRAVCAHLRL